MKRNLILVLLLFISGTGGAEQISPRYENITVDNALIVKASPWADVRAFGAKGDAVSDDAPAINAAIRSLPPQGGKVYIPNGNYRLGSSVLVNQSYVTIVGNGQGSLLWADKDVVAIQVASERNVQNTSLKSFFLIGRLGAAGGIRLGTPVFHAAFTKIEDMGISLFRESGGYGISLESVQELNVMDTSLYQNYNHIYHPVTGFVTSTTIQGNKGYIGWAENKGFVLEGSVASFHIRGIVIESNGRGAFSSTGWLSNITIEDCHIEANGKKGGTETIFVSSNSVSSPSRIRLSNNFFYGNARPILKVDNVIDSRVADNWGLFGAENAISTTTNSHLEFSMNGDRPADDVIRNHLSKLAGHISARERDQSTGSIKEYGSRIITSVGGYLALDRTHLRSTQAVPPSVKLHANAGFGATGGVASATDVKGQLMLTTGSGGWIAGEQIRVIFDAPYAFSPVVLLVPQNANAASAQAERRINIVSSEGHFSVDFEIADVTTRTYRWSYLVVE